MNPGHPIVGVFDSGVGGLSVLKALLAELPQARFVYLADASHAPYGERSPAQVAERAQRITAGLRGAHGIDALVVACNTATALAIESLREQHPDWPIVGVEPALKPAAALTRSGHVGVLATRGTAESERYRRLRERVFREATGPLHISTQACDGLADAIEKGEDSLVRTLCQRYLDALRAASGGLPAASGGLPPMDTLVLGCTHYPFAAETLQALCGPAVRLVETGEPVARRTRAVLCALQTASADPGRTTSGPAITLLSTGDTAPLTQAARRWLGLPLNAQPFAC